MKKHRSSLRGRLIPGASGRQFSKCIGKMPGIRRSRAVAAATIALVLCSVFGCSHSPDGQPDGSAVVRRGLRGEPASADPQRAGDTMSFELLRDIFEGLTSESPGGEIVPGVADNWSVSPDGLRYEFALRPEARWSNGDIVTAADFVAALQRAVDPSTGSPGAELLGLIRGARAVISGTAAPATLAVRAEGDHKLSIELVAPAPYFPSILANAVAYPLFRGKPPTSGSAQRGPAVSNGAYRLSEWVPGGKLTLRRNATYWDAPNVAISTVEYVPVPDSNAELARYRADELDVTSSVPASQLEALRTDLPTELQVRPQLAVVYYAFNLDRPPFRDAPGLREALSLAIDRQALTARVLRAGEVPAYSFVPPGIAGYADASYAWRSEQREATLGRARELYRAAGFSPERPLRLRLMHPADDPLRRVAIAVAAMWHEALGVDTTLTELEYRAFLAARNDRDRWDVLSHGWNADYPDPGNFLGIFTRASAQNDSHMVDPEFERLMATASADPDGARRLEELAVAERRMLAAYPVAPLYFVVTRRLVKPRVEGAILSPMNHNYSKYLSLRK
jgi:oligopeptide transport system substrate-binding protein